MTQRISRTLLFLFGDALFIALAFFLAFFLRFDGMIPAVHLYLTLPVMIVLGWAAILPVFLWARLYSFSWRHVSTRDVLVLWYAVTGGFLLITTIVVSVQGVRAFAELPRSTLLVGYVLTFFFTGAIRMAKRIAQHISLQNAGGVRVLIVGAGDAGEQLLRSMQTGQKKYTPSCFVDDDKRKQGLSIHGVRVAGTVPDIPAVAKQYGIQEMIIAMPSAPSSAIKRAVELGRQAQIETMKVLPSLGEILDGKVSFADVRDVQVQDLLGREVVSLDTDALSRFLREKIVLITGAAGSIGSELARQVSTFAPSVIVLLDQDESGIFMLAQELNERFSHVRIISCVGNITDEQKIERVFKQWQPHIVFHAAAYKHVPLMEADPAEAVRTNILGTRIVAEIAGRLGTECFVYISTDKAVNPTSVMGATKRVGEMICQELSGKGGTRFVAVRFGNVLDSRGNVVALFREQIKRGGPVKITDPEMKRYFMTNPEACLLVMQASAMGKGGEIFVLDMGSPVKIVDLAREMVRLSGLEADRDIQFIFTGMRPGEKLFEEMLSAEEGTSATQHQKIFIAKLPPLDAALLEKGLGHLQEGLAGAESQSLVDTLHRLVPSYR
ncbi:MAG: polysaccharide biosynthesis protein [Parcubacteria group bacterium]|nr:polysaccharide biosynthesis protein [Parcubacteria group bacterium]